MEVPWTLIYRTGDLVSSVVEHLHCDRPAAWEEATLLVWSAKGQDSQLLALVRGSHDGGVVVAGDIFRGGA